MPISRSLYLSLGIGLNPVGSAYTHAVFSEA